MVIAAGENEESEFGEYSDGDYMLFLLIIFSLIFLFL
jgi:hypothetical protein